MWQNYVINIMLVIFSHILFIVLVLFLSVFTLSVFLYFYALKIFILLQWCFDASSEVRRISEEWWCTKKKVAFFILSTNSIKLFGIKFNIIKGQLYIYGLLIFFTNNLKNNRTEIKQNYYYKINLKYWTGRIKRIIGLCLHYLSEGRQLQLTVCRYDLESYLLSQIDKVIIVHQT